MLNYPSRSSDEDREVAVKGKWSEFTIYSCSKNAAWSEHCRGSIAVTITDGELNAIDGQATLEARASQVENLIPETKSSCTNAVDCDM